MSDKQHKGQLQTVEGSAVGEFHVVPKFAYNATLQVEYLGEAKVGLPDGVNGHYIQKFVYDATLNLRRILTATNRATAGCTEVSIVPIGQDQARITAHNGDFKEVEYPSKGGGQPKKENELTTLTIKTDNNEFSGRVIKVNDVGDEVVVRLNDSSITVSAENNVNIPELNLTLLFNSDNKPYEKRRWTNRQRYFYDTLETE